MRNFDYARSRATALRLITRFGQPGEILSRANSGTPWDPTRAAATSRSCVLVETEYAVRDVDGTVVQASDRRVYVAASSLAGGPPGHGDSVRYSGKTGSVVSCRPLAPGGTNVLYDLQVRGVA